MSSRSSGLTRYRHTGSGSIDRTTLGLHPDPVGAGATVHLPVQPEDALRRVRQIGVHLNTTEVRHSTSGTDLATGLVGNKTSAIDETWSGLRFVVRWPIGTESEGTLQQGFR